MKIKQSFLLILFLTVKLTALSTIQITTHLRVEEQAFGVKEFNFAVEKTDYNFSINSFEKYINKGKYVNTNLHSYSNFITEFGDYEINAELITDAGIFNISFSLTYSESVKRIEINCLIGKDNEGNTFLKELTVHRFMDSSGKFNISFSHKPKLNESPVFQIKNKTKDTLYSATCVNFNSRCTHKYFGILNKEISYNNYSQYSPHKFCKSDSLIQAFIPKGVINAYISNGHDCDWFKIKDKGSYLFEIYFSNKKPELIEENTFPIIRTIDKYRLVKKFVIN